MPSSLILTDQDVVLERRRSESKWKRYCRPPRPTADVNLRAPFVPSKPLRQRQSSSSWLSSSTPPRGLLLDGKPRPTAPSPSYELYIRHERHGLRRLGPCPPRGRRSLHHQLDTPRFRRPLSFREYPHLGEVLRAISRSSAVTPVIPGPHASRLGDRFSSARVTSPALSPSSFTGARSADTTAPSSVVDSGVGAPLGTRVRITSSAPGRPGSQLGHHDDRKGGGKNGEDSRCAFHRTMRSERDGRRAPRTTLRTRWVAPARGSTWRPRRATATRIAQSGCPLGHIHRTRRRWPRLPGFRANELVRRCRADKEQPRR